MEHSFIKEIKDFDFDFQPSVNKAQILEFESLGFIDKQGNGVGKTHLANRIKKKKYNFIKCHFDLCKKAKLENRLDDLFDEDSKLFFQLIDN